MEQNSIKYLLFLAEGLGISYLLFFPHQNVIFLLLLFIFFLCRLSYPIGLRKNKMIFLSYLISSPQMPPHTSLLISWNSENPKKSKNNLVGNLPFSARWDMHAWPLVYNMNSGSQTFWLLVNITPALLYHPSRANNLRMSERDFRRNVLRNHHFFLLLNFLDSHVNVKSTILYSCIVSGGTTVKVCTCRQT